MAVDARGYVYVAGRTASANFPTVNAFQTAHKSFEDAFISVVSPDGSRLIYSSYLSGTGPPLTQSRVIAIAVDDNFNAYVAGWTQSANFPVRNGLNIVPLPGEFAAFAAKINCASSGDASLVYSTFLGEVQGHAGVRVHECDGIAVDSWGNAVIAGVASGKDSRSDIVVLKLSAGGGKLLFSELIPYSSSTRENHRVGGTAIDRAGNAFVVGTTPAEDFPVTQHAFQNRRAGPDDPNNPPLSFDGFAFKMPTFFRLDLNGDHQSDLLFQNSSDGSLACWLMNGNKATAVNYLLPAFPGAGWSVVGSADLNGDNTTDLLFQNRTTGDLAYWLMQGRAATSIGYITPPNPGANWNAVGMADFNQDGFADILFQNTVTGQLYVWYLHGARWCQAVISRRADRGHSGRWRPSAI